MMKKYGLMEMSSCFLDDRHQNIFHGKFEVTDDEDGCFEGIPGNHSEAMPIGSDMMMSPTNPSSIPMNSWPTLWDHTPANSFSVATWTM